MLTFIKDNLPILTKQNLSFLESHRETKDLYTFFFEPEKELHWKAGQHAILTFPELKFSKGTRPFSLSSAPEEKRLAITTRISSTPSEFKQALMGLKPGNKLRMRGPVGPLYLDYNSHSLLIAGGIGITPFRSILKQRAADNILSPVRLLYIDTNETFLFKEELDELASHSNTDILYINSRNDLYKEIENFMASHKQQASYCLGGSKTMVKSVQKFLLENGVQKNAIRQDPFYGL